jgi:adhesin transport system outer membrane protein
MLRLRYNFFRGFGDSERVRESAARIEEAMAQLARVRGELERDVRQAWEGLVADRSRVETIARYARASADVVEAYRLQFQLGQRTLLDVLNAENERYSAAANLVAATASVSAGELRVLAAMGRLVDAVALEVGEPEPARPQPVYEGGPETPGLILKAAPSITTPIPGEQHGR